MSRNFRLRPLSGDGDSSREESRLIDRRDFLRYSFNTAAGGITLASLGSIGFASLLMGQADSGGGDTAVRFWVPTGAEDTVWYGLQALWLEIKVFHWIIMKLLLRIFRLV